MKISVEKCCYAVCLLTTSGICFTQTCLHYPHQVWHLLSCSEAKHLLQFALWMMLMMTATLKLCQALVAKWGMIVLHRSQICNTHITWLSYERMQSNSSDTTHTTLLQLCGFCLGQPGWAGTRRNIHPLTLIVVINHPICFLHLLQSMASSSDTTGWNIPKTATHFTSSNDRSYCFEHCLGKRSGSCQRMLTNHNFV